MGNASTACRRRNNGHNVQVQLKLMKSGFAQLAVLFMLSSSALANYPGGGTNGVGTNVTLTVTDDLGQTASTNLTYTVLSNAPPLAACTATPTNGEGPLLVTFRAATSPSNSTGWNLRTAPTDLTAGIFNAHRLFIRKL